VSYHYQQANPSGNEATSNTSGRHGLAVTVLPESVGGEAWFVSGFARRRVQTSVSLASIVLSVPKTEGLHARDTKLADVERRFLCFCFFFAGGKSNDVPHTVANSDKENS